MANLSNKKLENTRAEVSACFDQQAKIYFNQANLSLEFIILDHTIYHNICTFDFYIFDY